MPNLMVPYCKLIPGTSDRYISVASCVEDCEIQGNVVMTWLTQLYFKASPDFFLACLFFAFK